MAAVSRRSIRPAVVFAFLVLVKVLARLVYRFDLRWLDDERPAARRSDPWSGVRVAALLHHTSLFDLLFIAGLPNRMLWLLARRVVAPGADVTLKRPIAGPLIRLLVHRMIPISRQRDETWNQVLDAIDEDAVLVLAPEGRMMRKTGVDKDGRPMTVRGGIADILETVETLPGADRLVLVYSQGLHHIQTPGDRLPRLFRTFAARLESLPIPAYVADRRAEAQHDGIRFKDAVIRDLEARRDRHCPVPGKKAEGGWRTFIGTVPKEDTDAVDRILAEETRQIEYESWR